MATYYFLGTVNTDWDNGANWNDAPDGSGSSGTVPGASDDAVIKALCVTATTSSSISVTNLTLDGATFGNNGATPPIPSVSATICYIKSNGFPPAVAQGKLIGITFTGNVEMDTSGDGGSEISGVAIIGSLTMNNGIVYNTTINGNAVVNGGNIASDNNLMTTYTTSVTGNVTFNNSGTAGGNSDNLNIGNDAIIGSTSSTTINIGVLSGRLIYTSGHTATVTVTTGPSAVKYTGYSPLYFNAGIDGDFSNLGNWWVNSGYTQSAYELPDGSDTVEIYASVTSNGSTVDTMNIRGSSNINTSITVNTVANFYDSSTLGSGGTITGNATVQSPHVAPFYASNGNNGTITGTLTYVGYTPRTLYLYSAMGAANWGTLFHWWTDSAHSTQATYLPLPIDDIIIESTCTSNSDGTNAAPSTVNILTLNSGSLGINISCDTCQVNNSASVGDSSNTNPSTLTVADTITFSDLSTIYGNGVVNTDIAILEDNSSLTGPGATLTANSINVYYPVSIPLDGTITGPITYFGYTYYFNDTTNSNNDGNWSTTNNWFLDSANTVAAGGPPSEIYPGENVALQSSVTTSTSGSPTAYNLTCGNQSGCPGDDPNPAFSISGTTIVVNGLATFQTDHFCFNSSTGGILGAAGTIDGDALFKDFGTNQGGTINGLATFTLQAAENMIDNAHGGNYNGGIEFQYGKGVNGSSILGIV